jgi:hypothetical protein
MGHEFWSRRSLSRPLGRDEEVIQVNQTSSFARGYWHFELPISIK